MPSQSFQNSDQTGSVLLPLSKFSYATVSGDSISPIPWIHLSSKNLFVVFANVRIENSNGNFEERRKLQVRQDRELMEDIDLDTLAIEAQRSMEEAQKSVSRTTVPTITVVVKAPCIAIRYPVVGGQIRRFQIRLTSTEDYYDAMKVLSRAQVPSTEAGTFPSTRGPTRPSTAQSSLLQPSDSVSNSGSRPVSVSSIQHDKDAPSRSPNAGSAWAASRTIQPSHSTSSAPRSILNPSNLLCATNSDRGPSHSTTHALSTFDDDRVDLENRMPSGYSAPQEHLQQPIDLYRPRPSTAAVPDTENWSQMLPPKRELPFQRPSSSKASRPSAAATNGTETTSRYFTRSSSIVPSGGGVTSATNANPSPAPASISTSSKRKRVAAVRAPAKREEADTSHTNAAAPTPAAKRSRAPSNRKKSGKAAVEAISVPSVEEILKRTQDSSEKADQVDNTIDTQALFAGFEERREQKALSAASTPGISHNAVQHTQPCAQLPADRRPADSAKQSNMDAIEGSVARSYPPQASSTIMHPTRRPPIDLDSNASTLGPGTITTDGSPAKPPSPPNTPSLVQMLLDQLSRVMNSDDIHAWAALPPTDRDAALETYICQQIDNDNFLQLCRTMEGTWQAMLIK